MPYRSRHFSVVEVADYKTEQSILQHLDRTSKRTRRSVEAGAVVDSQAGHHSPDMPAEAAADNNHPDQVDLIMHTLININIITSCENAAPAGG
jgi:hypothetical protein